MVVLTQNDLYKAKLDSSIVTRPYIKVLFKKKLYMFKFDILTSIPKELYDKLRLEQSQNFIFYKDGKMVGTKEKVVEKEKVNDKTILEGSIFEKKKKKESLLKKLLD